MLCRKLLLLGLVTLVNCVEKEGDDPLDWLRNSIPGEPGVDYPIFNAVEESDFSCEDKVFGGYYADPAMGCQVYHVCLLDPTSGSQYPVSFLCPNGTIFQQQIFNCDWWYNVDCAEAESHYGLVENAFGSDAGANGGEGGDGGQCPATEALSDAECEGTVSNCWSPGQTDTDCPNFGLCCFDGCANTCVDGPLTVDESKPEAQTTPRPTQRPADVPEITTEAGYEYPVPAVTLPVRPPTEVPEQLPALYGAPPRGGRQGRRNGRRLRNQQKKRRRGQRRNRNRQQ